MATPGLTTDATVKKRWSRLDPVFVRGMQRSGTSILFRALRAAGVAGFPEGHLWDELMEPLARIRDPAYARARIQRQAYFALGEGRDEVFHMYIALAVDAFHRSMLGVPDGRWFDKAPGLYAVRVLPMLATLFPKAQIVFVHRNGIIAVNSGLRLWGDSDPDVFDVMCRGWRDTMQAWRRMRGLCGGRFIELAQESIAGSPGASAARLASFLGLGGSTRAIADCFRYHRENTAFPEKEPRDYAYRIDWSEERKGRFSDLCAAEMRAWGYALDFDRPVGPSAAVPEPAAHPFSSMPSDYAWLRQTGPERVSGDRATLLAGLAAERDVLARLVDRYRSGKVLRVLLAVSRLWRRARTR